jgi:hypothetical protein
MHGDTIDSILRRYLETKTPDLMFSDADNDRIQELADKCTEGELDPEERREYEAYVAAGDLIALIEARLDQTKSPTAR